GAEPRVVIDLPGILRPIQRCRAALHGAVRVVPEAAALLAVGEAVEKQEVQGLVLPRGRGRGERPPGQGGEVDLQEAPLDLLGHWLPPRGWPTWFHSRMTGWSRRACSKPSTPTLAGSQ